MPELGGTDADLSALLQGTGVTPPCHLGSDTPVMSPHLCWRTGGLQSMETKELPSSVIGTHVTATLL